MVFKKKGQAVQALVSLVIGIATVAIVLIVTFVIISQGKSQIADAEGLLSTNTSECEKSLSCNATTEINQAVDDIPGWIPLIIIAGVGVALLLLVKQFKG